MPLTVVETCKLLKSFKKDISNEAMDMVLDVGISQKIADIKHAENLFVTLGSDNALKLNAFIDNGEFQVIANVKTGKQSVVFEQDGMMSILKRLNEAVPPRKIHAEQQKVSKVEEPQRIVAPKQEENQPDLDTRETEDNDESADDQRDIIAIPENPTASIVDTEDDLRSKMSKMSKISKGSKGNKSAKKSKRDRGIGMRKQNSFSFYNTDIESEASMDKDDDVYDR